ncbi:MAG: TrkA family potassium uptake protein [Firmicutes bacterium]|nr:TrkA family potassium uptake protein [Bacillota bacterium]
MRVIIVGGGEIVFFLAKAYMKRGDSVSIINADRDECENLSRRLNVIVVNGDATDPDILEDALARQAQALIAVTPYDHVNLVCCQTGSLMFGIPHTLAVANDPNNYEIFRKLGINHVFDQTKLLVSVLEEEVEHDQIYDILNYHNEQAYIGEISITASMPSCGKVISEIELPQDASIIGVARNKEFHFHVNSWTIQEKDKVLLLTIPDSHGQAMALLCGEDR